MTITSAKTSINKNKVPAIFKLVHNDGGWEFYQRNLDIGGGKFDTATKWLWDNYSINNHIYDPYNRTMGNNCYALGFFEYDTVTISNVLNVIESDARILDILHLAQAKVGWAGKVFISVYEGDRSGKFKIGKDSMQRNWKLDQYLPLVKQVFANVSKRTGYIEAWN